MKHRALLAIITCSIIATGCNCLVGHNKFLDNAMTKDAALAAAANSQVYAYVRSSDRAALNVKPYVPSPVVIQNGNRAASGLDLTSQRGRNSFASDVRNELDSMERDLARINSRAIQKGAAARAALDPEYRSFNTNIEAIDDQLDSIRAATHHREALLPKSKVDVLLDEARTDVRNAAEAVDRTPAMEGSNLP